MNTQRSERGQALVLIALSIVVIFGLAALAVDMGQIFAERRRMQSAADSAAFAVAYRVSEADTYRLKITEAQLRTIALSKAQENGLIPNAGGTQPRVVVTYHHPPVDGPYVGMKNYYQVVITSEVSQIFSQFVYSGQMEVTVRAVAHVRPVQPIFPGDALHASNAHDCDAIELAGGVDAIITGGNVFSNSDGTGGKGKCSSASMNGSGSLTVNEGDIVMVGDWRKVGSGTVSPAPKEDANPKTLPDMPTPDCSAATSRGAYKKTGGSSATIYPGRYSTIDINGGHVTMEPGMYCLDGDFAVGGNGSLTGIGVMIVMRQGDVIFNGGGDVYLTKPKDLEDASGQHWGGMLFYVLPTNTGGIEIGGNSSMTYQGTIYAPGERSGNKPKCDIGGTGGSIGLNANVVCDTVKLHGNALLDITYKEQENFRLPPIIELAE